MSSSPSRKRARLEAEARGLEPAAVLALVGARLIEAIEDCTERLEESILRVRDALVTATAVPEALADIASATAALADEGLQVRTDGDVAKVLEDVRFELGGAAEALKALASKMNV